MFENTTESDFPNNLIMIEAEPIISNNVYAKLKLLVDYQKGIVVKTSLYREGSLKQRYWKQFRCLMVHG